MIRARSQTKHVVRVFSARGRRRDYHRCAPAPRKQEDCSASLRLVNHAPSPPPPRLSCFLEMLPPRVAAAIQSARTIARGYRLSSFFSSADIPGVTNTFSFLPQSYRSISYRGNRVRRDRSLLSMYSATSVFPGFRVRFRPNSASSIFPIRGIEFALPPPARLPGNIPSPPRFRKGRTDVHAASVGGGSYGKMTERSSGNFHRLNRKAPSIRRILLVPPKVIDIYFFFFCRYRPYRGALSRRSIFTTPVLSR